MFNPNASLNFRPTTSYNDRLMIKAEMLKIQKHGDSCSSFFTTSEIRNAFMVGKVEINNQRLNKVKFNNLKIARNLH
jgi:hypothetical protein